jgi:hypothetical protein
MNDLFRLELKAHVKFAEMQPFYLKSCLYLRTGYSIL